MATESEHPMSTWVEILRQFCQRELPPPQPQVIYVTQAQADQIRATYPDDTFLDEEIQAGRAVIL